jgi:catechol 2,3-dioxygenase-like lactoylglutathione lyase family enzyme
MTIPHGVAVARPFLPTSDFEVSKAFYAALGFEQVFDGEVAIFTLGSTSLILQRYYQEEWASNFMMQLVVDDLDSWRAHIQSLDLPSRFGVKRPRAPAMQPWGHKVAYVFDPAGILWHLTERP